MASLEDDEKTAVVPCQTRTNLQDFDPPKTRKRSKYAFLCATLASTNSIILGYDMGIMTGAQIHITEDLNLSDVQAEILVGIINLYALLGALAAGRTSDWIGRRYTMALAGAIFFVGAILMGFSKNYPFLMFGRFVAGVGVGYAFIIAPVYTAEVSPTSSRGFLTSFHERGGTQHLQISQNFGPPNLHVFISGGQLLGYISNYGFSKLPTYLRWRLMLGASGMSSVFLAIIVLTMPESPRWLVMQGRLGNARRVLEKTYDSEEDAEIRLADIKEAVGIPENCTDEIVQVAKKSHGEGVWKEIFLHPTPVVCHIMIVVVGIHFFQQITGINAVILYSYKIFNKAGITSTSQMQLAMMVVGFIKTIFIVVPTFLLDRIGRRQLLLSSIGGMILSLTALGFTLTVINQTHHTSKWAVGLSITCVISYVALFSIGMGPITWVYSTEILPLRLRAQGASLGVIVNRVTSGVISMTFLSLCNRITPGGAFFLLAGITAVAFVFFYVLLPDTQGRTLEDIKGLFGNFLWKFSAEKKNKDVNGTFNRRGYKTMQLACDMHA